MDIISWSISNTNWHFSINFTSAGVALIIAVLGLVGIMLQLKENRKQKYQEWFYSEYMIKGLYTASDYLAFNTQRKFNGEMPSELPKMSSFHKIDELLGTNSCWPMCYLLILGPFGESPNISDTELIKYSVHFNVAINKLIKHCYIHRPVSLNDFSKFQQNKALIEIKDEIVSEHKQLRKQMFQDSKSENAQAT